MIQSERSMEAIRMKERLEAIRERALAQINVPVISLFVEQLIKSTNLHTFRVHVLPVIYPDRQLDERTASIRMQHTDYEQKCAAYVMAYGKKLTYDFEEGDIVGR